MNASRPSTKAELVEVLMENGQKPTCAYDEMGTIVYDWAGDGVFTTAERALEGIREKAADIGASGIYKLESTTGATVGQAMFGTVAVGSEVGLKAVAFACKDEKPKE